MSDETTGVPKETPIEPRKPTVAETMEDLENRFIYHAPKADQQERYVALREVGLEFAGMVLDSVPQSRERSLALTKLEEAIFWANAGIARNE